MPAEKTVVVIDDDPRILTVLTALLDENGYKVIGIPDPQNFMKEFVSLHPNLIVCDIQLPVINGIELLRWVKKTSPTTPVIVTSALATAETRKRVQQFGADDCFDKPIDLSRFMERVHDLIGKEGRSGHLPYALVADDHPQTRDFLADFLVSQGWEVERAIDGEDAVRRARTSARPFDVAFIDIVMPRLGGLAAIHAIRVASPTTALAAITGEATAEEVKSAQDNGAAMVIPKPFDRDDLLQRLSQLAKESERLKKRAVRNDV